MTVAVRPAAIAGALKPPLPAGRPLRVALVTETYPPEVNGVAATIARVVDGLQSQGHALTLVRPRQEANGEARLDINPVWPQGPALSAIEHVLVHGLQMPRYPQLQMGLPCKRRLLRLWSKQRPDVVHVVTEGPLGLSALHAALQLRLPVVSDYRTNFHAYSGHYGVGWLQAPVRAYLRWFHNRAASTMVPTESLRSELAAAGFKRLAVVARGVDTKLFDPARRSDALRASWGAGPKTMVAISVGRLAPEKNLGTVLAAFETMRADCSEMRLVFVGEGPEAARLKERCPHAVHAGLRRGEALAAHYASADVFLFPSLTETWGNVVPEDMASGLAVVAYDCAAAGQLIRHGDNGLLARAGDNSAFRAMARRLAGDAAQARALGAAARSSAGRLDWTRIVEAVENEYEAAISAAASLHGAWPPPLPAA